MSKQSSLFTFTGKMDGVSFYQNRKGQHLARKARGPSKARILTDPKFVRTRENLSEFSGLALSVSSFTKVFASVRNMKDEQLRTRLVKILRSMVKRDEGIRGQRSIEVSVNRELLHNVELNSTIHFATAFAPKPKVTHSADRTTGSITFTNVQVNNALSAPPVATHFKLVQLLGVVSDMVYDPNLKQYAPSDAANNSLHEVTMTDYIPVNGGDPLTITLETTLVPTGALGDKVSVVQCVGILFFEKIGPVYYAQGLGKAMKIVDVF